MVDTDRDPQPPSSAWATVTLMAAIGMALASAAVAGLIFAAGYLIAWALRYFQINPF